jgi:hypothetical protein
MIEFVEEVERIECGSIDLSRAILNNLGWTYDYANDDWTNPKFEGYITNKASNVSCSIDLALKLLPSDYNWLIHDGSGMIWRGGGFASLYKRKETGEYTYTYGRAATPALALCSAILRIAGEEAMQELSDLGQEIEQGMGKET